MSGGRPMSTSAPMRTRVARPEPSTSKLTRCPCRSRRNTEPSRASDASRYSLRVPSVVTTTPSLLPGSKLRTTPCMSGLLDLARLDAAGAHVQPPRRAVDECAHALHVRVPAPVGPAVRVAEALAEDRLLAAQLADGCHRGYLDRIVRSAGGRTPVATFATPVGRAIQVSSKPAEPDGRAPTMRRHGGSRPT